MHLRVVMRTLATLSLFTLAPALLLAPAARADVVYPPAQQDGLPTQPGYAPPTQDQMAVANPYQNQTPADPYQTPADPYQATDPAQVDWPQDLPPEEAAVDSYDDGYDPQAYAQFQDDLAPYGNWVDDGTYGRVWVPESTLVGADFTPYYSGGHWVLTEFGWTWVSDWSWGWAPFHYGRWVTVSGYGWCWVPGTIWGPAWVTWRSGGGWVGWAAMPPRGVSVAVTYGHRSPWRFTRAGDLGAPRPRCVPMNEMRGLFRRTTIVANDRVLTRGNTTVHINAGPTYIPRATPARLQTVAPRAFPQRAIYPHPGATMSDRPWIRAAGVGEDGLIAGGASAHRGVGPVASRGFSTRVSNSTSRTIASPPPRIYNPPRTFASTAAPHAFGSPAPAYGASRAYNPPAANTGPRIYEHPAPAYGAPRAYGAPGGNNAVRVYSPPSRPFAQAPAYSAPRSFAPPAAHAAPSFHQTYSPPMHAAPSHSFSAPMGGGGFGHANGGAHFGGGHRR